MANLTDIDWTQYPKLASWFEHRPKINVYWLELEKLLKEAYGKGYDKGCDDSP